MTGLLPIQPPHLLLGSASPRRKALLKAMGLEFQVRSHSGSETYPLGLKSYEITNYLSQHKAKLLKKYMREDGVLLTADTIVWQDDSVLEKPGNRAEASSTLRRLSGATHQVITSVCFMSRKGTIVKHEITEVRFARLTTLEIEAYLQTGNPMDKAGAYGIQEWIGLIGVERIKGSYTNVVGLPTRLVYKTLRDMASAGF